MTLHGLIHEVSQILTPKTDSFYRYVLHSSDDNGGFLRTRYCLWDRPVPDHKIPPLEKALVCFREPFCEDYGEGADRVKLQLFYKDEDPEWSSTVSWSGAVGFGVPYLFDLKAGTYQVLDAPLELW